MRSAHTISGGRRARLLRREGRVPLPGQLVAIVAVAVSLRSTPVYAHDAFGDLGPFYASILHPLADPLQAAILIGTAAFLAGRSLALTRAALPVYAGTAILGAGALVTVSSVVVPPALAACTGLVAGLSALLPETLTPRPVAFALVAATGVLTGIAPGAPTSDAVLHHFFGTAVGIAALATLAWFGLETASRRLTPLVPKVAGSWVAALSILVAGLSL